MAQDEAWKVRMEHDMADIVRAVAQRQGLSLNRYVLKALTNQIQVDVENWSTGHLQKIVQEGTAKTTIAANFAAIQSQAIMILLKKWRTADIKKTEGLPEELARQKVQVDMDEALALAAEVFQDPRVQQRYAWVERPESTEDLPDWLTDEDDDDGGNGDVGDSFP
jgi:hypothetical protein